MPLRDSLRTPAGVEVDLVAERPGKPLFLIEIKSTEQVQAHQLSALSRISKEIERCEAR